MNTNDIITMISSVGFPIVMCGMMAYYIKHTADETRKEREESETKHKEEMDRMAEAVNNNTQAITLLCEKLER